VRIPAQRKLQNYAEVDYGDGDEAEDGLGSLVNSINGDD